MTKIICILPVVSCRPRLAGHIMPGRSLARDLCHPVDGISHRGTLSERNLPYYGEYATLSTIPQEIPAAGWRVSPVQKLSAGETRHPAATTSHIAPSPREDHAGKRRRQHAADPKRENSATNQQLLLVQRLFGERFPSQHDDIGISCLCAKDICDPANVAFT